MKVLIGLIALALLLASPTLAQQTPAQQTPDRTMVGHTWLGETFDEKFPPEAWQKALVGCAPIYKLADEKPDIFATGTNLPLTRACLVLRDAKQGKDAVVPLPGDANGPTNVLLHFVKSKVIEIRVLWDAHTTFDEQMTFLIQKYGPPTTRGTSTVQNAYGAQWEVGRATWALANGDSIRVDETVNVEENQRREVLVTFWSKDAPAPPQVKNPY